jgi:hypothetical protein
LLTIEGEVTIRTLLIVIAGEGLSRPLSHTGLCDLTNPRGYIRVLLASWQ